MQLNEISARGLQSSCWADMIFAVHHFHCTSSWNVLEFHSTCLHSVSYNYTRQTNGFVSELYAVNGKLCWKFSVITLVSIFLRCIENNAIDEEVC